MEKGIWIISGIYITVMAVADIRKKEIAVLPGAVCALGIVILQLIRQNGWKLWVPGAGIGLMLWIISRLSHGAVGEGDALVYAVMGLAVGFTANLEILMVSLFLAAVVGIGMMIGKKAGKKDTMPFIPFTAAAYILVLCL